MTSAAPPAAQPIAQPIARPAARPTVSLVVATHGPPRAVRAYLHHLESLGTAPLEVVVLDASDDGRAGERLRRALPDVRVVRPGPGGTPGLAELRGDVVAFVHDDARAAPGWLDALVAPYADPDVAGVGGRVVDAGPQDEADGLELVGRLLPDGRLTDRFGTDPGRVVDVDHLHGAAMSFRRTALAAAGGVSARGCWVGTDLSLRVRAGGGRLVFAPRAVVHHDGRCGALDTRSDLRSLYHHRRDHVVTLVRLFGWRDPILRRFARTVARDQGAYVWAVRARLGPRMADGSPRPLLRRVTAPVVLAGIAAELGGLVAGLPAAAAERRRDHAARRLDGAPEMAADGAPDRAAVAGAP
ncbi:glycosyltransferase family 2 protein [Puerhibacterium sp. TATVAM-FAB25]|uniref:glycosyltransferase family 2 protein n=1 Tax=Puerhibacterium sp. TATVAM-FAB25 TaxID=3093699 RepID=UPI00397E467A